MKFCIFLFLLRKFAIALVLYTHNTHKWNTKNTKSVRKHGRVIIDSPEMADYMFNRIQCYLPQKWNDRQLIGINPRFCFFFLFLGFFFVFDFFSLVFVCLESIFLHTNTHTHTHTHRNTLFFCVFLILFCFYFFFLFL